jgi:hypothetical protein
MSTQQKQAWFMLAAFGLACIAYLVAGLLVGFDRAWPAFALYGLGGFAGFIRGSGKPDERDKAIKRRAVFAAFAASYATLFVGCFGAWAIRYYWQHEDQIPGQFLWQLGMIAGGMFFFVWSVAIVVLYGRRVEADHD